MFDSESKLERALRAAVDAAPEEVSGLLRDVSEQRVASASEAALVVALLRRLPFPPSEDYWVSSTLHTAAAFMQTVAGEDAFRVFATDAVPELFRILAAEWHAALAEPAGHSKLRSNLMFLMKLLTLYSAEDGERPCRRQRTYRNSSSRSKSPRNQTSRNFLAMAEMCTWLAHPAEFGKVPADITLFDTRELYWPPTDDSRRVWLFRYEYPPWEGEVEPRTGIGMVGSTTFALFGEATVDLSPEAVYALHCAWELEAEGDPRAPAERSIEAGMRILSQHNPGFAPN